MLEKEKPTEDTQDGINLRTNLTDGSIVAISVGYAQNATKSMLVLSRDL